MTLFSFITYYLSTSAQKILRSRQGVFVNLISFAQ